MIFKSSIRKSEIIYDYKDNNTTRNIMKNKEKCIFYKPELYNKKYDKSCKT